MARPRGNRWQADVLIEGVRKRPSFSTRDEAEAYERAIEQGLPAVQSVTFGPFIDQYFDHLWGDTKRPESSRISCKVLRKFIGDDTLIRDINTQRVIDITTRMKAAGLANGTINRKLSALSKVLKLAVRLDIITKRPELDFQKEGIGRDRILSKDEETKAVQFFTHMGLDLSLALFKFLLYTGCRVGEAYTVKAKHVEDGRVTFRGPNERGLKNGDIRQIRLVSHARDAWAIIVNRGGNHEHPFEVIPLDTFRGHWQLLRKHLGLLDDECFVPHMLRHTCATRLVQAGVPLPQVMKWMGHKNIQTTMRYSHLLPKDLDMAAQALEAA